MKKYILIITIFLSVKTFSQYLFTPINFDNSQWNYIGYILGENFLPEYMDVLMCQFGNDTLINSKQYYKFQFEKHSWYYNEQGSHYFGTSTGYAGSLRKEGFKCYFVPKNNTSEFLLYDFENISVGDTILKELTPNDYLVIDSIYLDTMFDNSIRKVYSGSNNHIEYFKLIEGIGIDHYKFGGLVPPEFVVTNYLDYDGGFTLNRYCENRNLVFCQEGCSTSMDCDYSINIEKVFHTKFNIKIWPNPTKQFLNIEYTENINQEELCFTIINTFGQEIYLLKAKNLIRIDISDLKRGIYFIKIDDSNNNRLLSSKLIIKE